MSPALLGAFPVIESLEPGEARLPGQSWKVSGWVVSETWSTSPWWRSW
jgi:hypothetical protein